MFSITSKQQSIVSKTSNSHAKKKKVSAISTNIIARIPNHPETTSHHHPFQATFVIAAATLGPKITIVLSPPTNKPTTEAFSHLDL
jgi:hypothetical protein